MRETPPAVPVQRKKWPDRGGIKQMGQGRLIMYHKQGTSARTLFLQLDHGGVCAFEPIPRLAAVIEDDTGPGAKDNVRSHPAPLLSHATEYLGLEKNKLEVDGEFQALLDVPGEQIEVYLARFTTQDPPYKQVDKIGASFVPLTALRNLPPTELELLREAYKIIMG